MENNVNLELREVAYTKSKDAIARACRKLIHNGDSIFLDPSTTALFIAKASSDMRLTVVTIAWLIRSEERLGAQVCRI